METRLPALAAHHNEALVQPDRMIDGDILGHVPCHVESIEGRLKSLDVASSAAEIQRMSLSHAGRST